METAVADADPIGRAHSDLPLAWRWSVADNGQHYQTFPEPLLLHDSDAFAEELRHIDVPLWFAASYDCENQ